MKVLRSEQDFLKYIPALDGFRAFVVLIVFLFHVRVPGFSGGYLGVDIFFVLSGFLITSLLLNEFSRSGHIDLRRFYGRRIRRLMPALCCLCIAYPIIAPLSWPDYPHQRDVLFALFYLNDLPRLAFASEYIGHTWSLAVEMHYYLLWPLLFLAIAKFFPKKLLPILVCLYVAATLWRLFCLFNGQKWGVVYLSFDTRLSGLLLGSLLAVAMPRLRKIEIRKLWLSPFLTFLGVNIIISTWQSLYGLSLGTFAAEFCACMLIIAAHKPQGFLDAALSNPAMMWIGKRSYGIYLYHLLPVYVLRDAVPWPVTLGITLPLSLLLAQLSYQFIERKFHSPLFESSSNLHMTAAV